jgi:hypothetical protein
MKTATLLFVGLGLLAGWCWGDEVRRRKNAETRAVDLSDQLDKLAWKKPPAEQQLKQMAGVLNDTHKRITAVSKALLKPAQ